MQMLPSGYASHSFNPPRPKCLQTRCGHAQHGSIRYWHEKNHLVACLGNASYAVIRIACSATIVKVQKRMHMKQEPRNEVQTGAERSPEWVPTRLRCGQKPGRAFGNPLATRGKRQSRRSLWALKKYSVLRQQDQTSGSLGIRARDGL